MKIIYDISVLGAGHCYPRARTGIFRVIENLAYGLASSKECDLFLCASESFQKLHESLNYIEDNPRFEGIYLPRTELAKVILAIYKKVLSLNTIISKGRNASKDKVFYLRALGKLLDNVERSIGTSSKQIIPSNILAESDIFHSPFYYAIPELKKATNQTKFFTVYDLIPILYPHLFEFNEVALLNNMLKSLEPENCVICISHTTKNDLCNYLEHIDHSRVFVTHLAASELFYPCFSYEQKVTISQKYNIPDIPYFLSLSTLEPRKNIDHVIRCFAKLVKQENIKNLNLVLVGVQGWNYGKIFNELANYKELQDRIIITGYVADGDLAALYSGALAFVYPSFYEGFGLPPLEAMQCGVPVITSNTSSLPEVVGDAGIMVHPTDVDALCHSMLEIYNRPSLREAMSLKSIERAKQFSWQKCTQETIAAYKAALSR